MHSTLSVLSDREQRGQQDQTPLPVDLADGEVMARRVFAVSRLTIPMMIANIINAASIPLVLYLGDQARLDAYIWATTVIAFASYFLFQQHARRLKPFPLTLSPRVYRRSILHASLLGGLWAYPGLVMLPEVEGTAQAFLLTIAAGMVAGGAISLYPMPRAAYAFCGIMFVGSMAGFSRTDDPTFWAFAIVSTAFGLVIYRSISRHERIFVSEFALRRLLDRQNEHMGEMLEQAREEVRSERKRAEKQLLQTQKMEAVGQLTAGIAHDFNNLLTAVRGNAELLKMADDAQNDLIDPIIQSADNGASLVRQLLAFARKQTLVPTPVSPRQAIEDTAELLRRSLREDIRIKTEASDDLWTIRIDPNLFSNALLNLGTNARDAMPHGGSITITAQNFVNQEDASGNEEFVRVSFCDTGTGMPEHLHERAIEPFFTTKEFGAGSGLGLSMVYGFVKQSGGDMLIESALGQGTCVHLDLPRSLETPDQPDPVAPVSRPTGQSKSVLLIEDNPTVRQTLMAIIESLEYKVTGVESVELAREALANAPQDPDVLVTDIVLPGGQWGTELAREVTTSHPDMGVLLISGFHSDLETLGLDPDLGSLLAKPFSREELAAALNALAAGQKA